MNSKDAYEFAWQHAARNDDGSVIEQSLVDLITAAIDFDVDKAKRGLAQRILSRRKRPGQTAPEGTVVFNGMEHYSYEPHRLLSDDKGNLIENAESVIQFKTAEAKRAQSDAQAAAARAAREQNEAGHFAVWTAEQYAKGRDKSEITWDTCVRETGLWKDADVDQDVVLDEEPDDGEST